jgi:hypothetical protein
MRKMTSWPALSDFLRTQAAVSSSASLPEASVNAVGISDNLPGYGVSDFVCPPNLDNFLTVIVQAYRINALKRFDAFYQDKLLREAFIQQMGLTSAEKAAVISTAPQLQPVSQIIGIKPESLTAKLPQNVSTPKTPATQSNKITEEVKVVQVVESTKPNEKVVSANSLLDKRFLVEETHWRISLVKRKDKEHAFLLLEGIANGVPVHLRSDLFMDLDSRAQVAANIPSAIGSAVQVVSGHALEDCIGRGFVRTKELTPQEFQQELGQCEYQSWPITVEQAQRVRECFEREARKPVGAYSYSLVPGNDSSRFASRSSGIRVQNCLSWCRDILQETVGIRVGSSWALAQYPSQVIRQTKIEQDKTLQPERSFSSPSYSGTLFASSSPSTPQPANNSGNKTNGSPSLASLFAQQRFS